MSMKQDKNQSQFSPPSDSNIPQSSLPVRKRRPKFLTHSFIAPEEDDSHFYIQETQPETEAPADA